MSMKPFLCMSYSTILLLQRTHDEVVTTLMDCHRTSSLILALCMTLPSYEGYASGSRYDAKVVATQKGMGICMVMETKYFQKTFQKPHQVPLMPRGDDELGSHLMTKWCTEASVYCFQN